MVIDNGIRVRNYLIWLPANDKSTNPGKACTHLGSVSTRDFNSNKHLEQLKIVMTSESKSNHQTVSFAKLLEFIRNLLQ